MSGHWGPADTGAEHPPCALTGTVTPSLPLPEPRHPSSSWIRNALCQDADLPQACTQPSAAAGSSGSGAAAGQLGRHFRQPVKSPSVSGAQYPNQMFIFLLEQLASV